MKRIAAFITPHGFGHTTRCIAVLETLQRRFPDLAIEVFTTAPEHLFRESLTNYTFHKVITDVGLVQHDALNSDIPATIAALNNLLPFPSGQVRQLADSISGCSCVLCDIAPLGIVVAQRAGIPSVLIENFTWDWIYQPSIAAYPELERHAKSLALIYAQATVHIQADPVCTPNAKAISCPSVFRKNRESRQNIRKKLDIGKRKLILISLGGLDFTLPHWQQLHSFTDCLFVLAGQPERKTITANCLALTHKCNFYHPDLITAADLVVFKCGYSTVAECLQAGARTACISRPEFIESATLAAFVKTRLGGTILNEHTFLNGRWLAQLPEMLATPLPPPARENGADRIADILLSMFREQR